MSYNLQENSFFSNDSFGIQNNDTNHDLISQTDDFQYDFDSLENFNDDNDQLEQISLKKVMSSITRDNIGLESVYGINYISFLNQNNLEDSNCPYCDYIIFPNNSLANKDSSLFEVRINHVTKDDFYKFVSEYNLKSEANEIIPLDGFYNYLTEKNIDLKVLQ